MDTAQIVNLRRARKKRDRLAAEVAAAAKRARHGQSTQARVAVDTEMARAARLLDGASRDLK